MAKIVTITVGLTESVNTAPYTYVKPEISLTAEVSPEDDYDEVFKELNKELKKRMQDMIEKIESEVYYEEN
jgi:hypothetical protein